MPKWPDDFSPVGSDGTTPSKRRKAIFDAYQEGFKDGFQKGLAAQPRPVGVPDGLPKLELWFFRELTDEQRLKLFSIHGLPVDEIGPSQINQKRVLRHLLAAAPAPAKAGE